MDRPRHRSPSVLDITRWHADGELELSPKFQRRLIWPPKARSYLIDTILRGFPIPKIYMRQQLELSPQRTIREVVDGQQRLDAVLSFYADDLRLSRHHGESGGKLYSQLPEDAQKGFLTYEFSVDLLVDASDADVLDVFSRINSYSVPLNKQEKRNAKFFGAFKQVSYKLGLEHLEFWKRHHIFTDRAMTRMTEVEMTSELLVAMAAGMQDKKNTLDDFYEAWDEDYPSQEVHQARFRESIDRIELLLEDTLEETAFRRPPLFYSLFLAIYALLFGELGVERKRAVISASRRRAVQAVVARLSDVVRADEPPRGYGRFYAASQRQTDNIQPRRTRLSTLLKEIATA